MVCDIWYIAYMAYGMVRCCVMWSGSINFFATSLSTLGPSRHFVWYGMVWYGVYGMVWFGVVWCGMV